MELAASIFSWEGPNKLEPVIWTVVEQKGREGGGGEGGMEMEKVWEEEEKMKLGLDMVLNV